MPASPLLVILAFQKTGLDRAVPGVANRGTQRREIEMAQRRRNGTMADVKFLK
jgi:hypothetical protein